jgi:geranylgeranyl reductase family protein
VDHFDALIVGGGPAGSSCAWKLQQGGLKVLVLDKKAFPRDKPCAGWITPQVVEALQLDMDAYRRGRTWQPITGFRCGLIGGEEVEVRYPQPISFGIRRCEFDNHLLQRSGAEVRLGEAAESIQRQPDGWLVNQQYRAPLLIGAGGHFCPVARSIGARQGGVASVVVAQEVEFQAGANDAGNVQAQMPALYFCRDLRGYGWCFRKEGYLNIGLGRTDSQRLSSHVAEFRQFLAERKIASCNGRAWAGHAYQLYDNAEPLLVGDGVLLIGDAAGLAYPQSGEGIRPAVESGLIAAAVILQAAGKYRREDLADYPARLVARLGKPATQGMLGWLPAAWLHALASKLLVQRWFSRHVVMDQWFLHRNQRALAF